MSEKHLSTDPYKGVRDFYPEDMAVQRYIFDTWAKTAESFGYERYDASVLEPSLLYKSKGAENEEMVNEQTYTFTDRGDREVTLRPEMTPTVARMVAGKRRDLVFPLRWYSIPNLFRYERMQRGRLREHWQLNCDLFGGDDLAADTEVIALAYQTLINFGATPSMFEIRVNNREAMRTKYASCGITDDAMITSITRLNDRKRKISAEEYRTALYEITKNAGQTDAVVSIVEQVGERTALTGNLEALGISNVVSDPALARGFDYYTGTIFEIFDVSGENNRSLLGGGRYDNLTGLFSDEKVTGIGFGMGDVTMRDFLETHNLLEGHVPTSGPMLLILTTEAMFNTAAALLAKDFRAHGVSVAVDISSKKLDKKLSDANKRKASYVIVFGDTEASSATYTLKRMSDGHTVAGSVLELLSHITQ